MLKLPGQTVSSRMGQLLLRALVIALAFVVPLIILLDQPAPLAGKGAYDWHRVWAWVTCLLGLLCLFAVCGWEMRQRVWGALIDERNRYSLSRLQMSLWTILVLGSLYVVFMANAVRGGASFDALNVKIDSNLVVLMGLSVASFVTAPMALSLKKDKLASADELAKANSRLVPAQHLSTAPTVVGRLLIKGTPADARIADLIRGEDVGAATVVDLPRTQMLMMTFVVVVAFGAAVCTRLGQGDWLLDKLPTLSETLLLLVLVSHGGYLAGKLIPTTTSASGPSAEHMSRALVASQRATDVVNELKLALARTGSGDSRRSVLELSLSHAQALAADAAQLPTRAAAADFKADEIAAMEGRVQATQASVRTQVQGRGALGDAPASQTVAKVQRKLAALGYPLRETGTPDADTEGAIATWLAANGASRSSLHPNRMRYYEELAQLV